MHWLFLAIASIFEIGFSACLIQSRQHENTHKIYWVVGFGICFLLSMFFLYMATQKIPMGIAYAIWTGIGTVGAVSLSIIFKQEAVSFLKIFFISTLILSIVGLKFLSK